jgi:hypothetical protein
MDIEGSRIFGLLAASSKHKPIINEKKKGCKGKIISSLGFLRGEDERP